MSDIFEDVSTVNGFLIDRKKREGLMVAWNNIRNYIMETKNTASNKQIEQCDHVPRDCEGGIICRKCGKTLFCE